MSQITTLQATRSKQADIDPNGALAHKRNVGTLADIAQVIAAIFISLHMCFRIFWAEQSPGEAFGSMHMIHSPVMWVSELEKL